jgi:Tat protein translocase TatB subunit
MDFMGIGPLELLLIFLIIFVVVGPQKLPDIARKLGKAVYEFKKYSSNLNRDFKAELEKEMLKQEESSSEDKKKTGVASSQVASSKKETVETENVSDKR